MAGIFTICFAVANGAVGEENMRGAWVFCILLCTTIGALLHLYGCRASPKLYYRETFALIASVWIITILIGTLPYQFFISQLSYADALFESTSGFTSTGATILDNLENLPRSLLFFRSISQWIGGLGMIIFFIIFLPSIGSPSKLLFAHENVQHYGYTSGENLRERIWRMWRIYAYLTVCCAVAYGFAGMEIFDAICYALSTISTGGFGTHCDGIHWFQCPAVEWVAVLFMILGGMNFLSLHHLMGGQWEKLRKNSELRAYFVILLLFTTIISVALYARGDVMDYLRTGIFHGVSFLTTSGFIAADCGRWMLSVHVLLLVSMFIGGCSGSTAGGMKIIRLLMAMKMVWTNGERSFCPHLIKPITIDGHSCSRESQERVAHYFILVALSILFLLPIYAMGEPLLSFEEIFNGYIACLCNTGVTLSGGSYAHLHGHSKCFLSLIMLFGRLEMQVIFTLFMAKFWRRFS